MSIIDELTVQAARNSTIEQSAAQLIRDLAQLLIDRQADVVKIQEIMDTLKTSADSLEATIAEVNVE